MIEPRKLFSEDILSYQVSTQDLGITRYVNLDNAATTPPFTSVQGGVVHYLTTYGSVHRGAGTKSKVSTDHFEQARETVKSFVGAPESSYVLFTGNTTAAMNAAAYFFSFLEGMVAVSEVEHSASWLPFIKAEGTKALGNRQVILGEVASQNVRIQQLGREQVLQYDVNENFEFELSAIEAMLQQHKVKALVLTAASNATGYRPPIKEIGELAHRYGAYFVVDACQFIQHHPLNMVELGIDFLAASGHKFYAPFGGGFLIGPKGFLDQFLPYEIGGGNLPYITAEGEFLRYESQQAHDPGTPNAVGAVAMALALQELSRIGIHNVEAYERTLAERAYASLEANSLIRLHVPCHHLNSVISFSIKGKDPRQVAEELNDRFGVGVRAGSFCVYNVVRKLLGITDDSAITQEVKAGNPKAVPGFIRASVGLCTTEEDIDRFLQAVGVISTPTIS